MGNRRPFAGVTQENDAGKGPLLRDCSVKAPLTTTKGAGAAQTAKTPVGSRTGWAVCESRAGASLTRPQPVPQDFGCRRCEKGRRKPWWLARAFEDFVRQNPTAEPSFSYATPAFMPQIFSWMTGIRVLDSMCCGQIPSHLRQARQASACFARDAYFCTVTARVSFTVWL